MNVILLDVDMSIILVDARSIGRDRRLSVVNCLFRRSGRHDFISFPAPGILPADNAFSSKRINSLSKGVDCKLAFSGRPAKLSPAPCFNSDASVEEGR